MSRNYKLYNPQKLARYCNHKRFVIPLAGADLRSVAGNSAGIFVGIAIYLRRIIFVKLMKDFTDIYGILYNCPVGEGCQDYPIQKAENLSFKDKVQWFNRLCVKEKSDIQKPKGCHRFAICSRE